MAWGADLPDMKDRASHALEQRLNLDRIPVGAHARMSSFMGMSDAKWRDQNRSGVACRSFWTLPAPPAVGLASKPQLSRDVLDGSAISPGAK
jgi:hypothetical protein